MIDERTARSALAALVLSGCIVAPCPKDRQCTAVASTGGGPGAGGGGGARAGNGGVGTAGTAGSAGADSSGDGSPPDGTWVNITGNLAGMDSECGNMSYLSAKPEADVLIAGIALNGLWASKDQGQSWQALGKGPSSAPITNSTSAIVYDPNDPKRYWESGIYGAGGLFETKDDGATFVALADVRHNDAVSIDFTDPERKTLLAGGHEQSQKVYRSADGGVTWSEVGGNLPANTDCTHPLAIDGQVHLVGCGGYGGGTTGIFRTTDGGANWTQVSDLGGANAPLRASDGSLYWATPDAQGMARSTDDGQSWTETVGAGILTSAHPIELPDGRIASLGPRYGTQYVMVSADRGAHWAQATTALPYEDARGVLYSTQRKALYIWHSSCGTGGGSVPVPPDAIFRYDFDGGSP
jgi:hypothetical protein